MRITSQIQRLLRLTVAATLLVQPFQGTASASPISAGFRVPAAFGSITDSSPLKAGQKPDVILVQDLHVNRSVQFAISDILHALKKQGVAPQRIAIEGASGDVETASMQAMKDRRWRRKTADYMVRQGEMPGAMHFVVTEGNGGLYGIEEKENYEANLEVFRQSYKDREALSAELAKIADILPDLKRNAALNANADLLEKDIATVRDLLAEQVTPEEVPSTLRHAAIAVAHLKQILPEEYAARLDRALNNAANFYTFALIRDGDLFANTLKLRQLDHQSTTVLVAGGFHADGLLERCKALGLSYAVITPALRHHDATDDRLYIRRLLGQHLTDSQLATGYDFATQNMIAVWAQNVNASWNAASIGVRRASKMAAQTIAVVTLMGLVGWSKPVTTPLAPQPVIQEAAKSDAQDRVSIVRTKDAVWLNNRGTLVSGMPGFAYQPTPNGTSINDFEVGRMRFLYKALLPVGGAGIDAEKYPHLKELAVSRQGAPAQNDGESLERVGAKFIRTYDLSKSSAEDLKIVAELFDWLYATHKISVVVGLYDPTPAQAVLVSEVFKDRPSVLFFDGWNEINQRGGTTATSYQRIDAIAGIIKRTDPKRLVGIVLAQPLTGAVRKAVQDMKNIDVVGVTVYDRGGEDTKAFIDGLQEAFAPKMVVISEIGVNTKKDPAARARVSEDIAKALTMTEKDQPKAAPLVTWFEWSPEEWKGADNMWGYKGTAAGAAIAAIHQKWIPGPAASSVQAVEGGKEKTDTDHEASSAEETMLSLNENYRGADYLGYYIKTTTAESGKILANSSLSFKVSPRDFATFTGFHVDLKDEAQSGVYGLYVLKRNGKWIAVQDGNRQSAAKVTINATDGTVTVSVPMSEVKTAMKATNARSLREFHVQTGAQQGGVRMNAENVPASIHVRAFSEKSSSNQQSFLKTARNAVFEDVSPEAIVPETEEPTIQLTGWGGEPQSKEVVWQGQHGSGEKWSSIWTDFETSQNFKPFGTITLHVGNVSSNTKIRIQIVDEENDPNLPLGVSKTKSVQANKDVVIDLAEFKNVDLTKVKRVVVHIGKEAFNLPLNENNSKHATISSVTLKPAKKSSGKKSHLSFNIRKSILTTTIAAVFATLGVAAHAADPYASAQAISSAPQPAVGSWLIFVLAYVIAVHLAHAVTAFMNALSERRANRKELTAFVGGKLLGQQFNETFEAARAALVAMLAVSESARGWFDDKERAKRFTEIQEQMNKRVSLAA